MPRHGGPLLAAWKDGTLPCLPFLLDLDAAFIPGKPKWLICKHALCMLQDVRVFSEDGTSRVVEIAADMTARDLCQLLVYRSHCVDDNSWTLVEHHPHLGLGRERAGGPGARPTEPLPRQRDVCVLSPLCCTPVSPASLPACPPPAASRSLLREGGSAVPQGAHTAGRFSL